MHCHFLVAVEGAHLGMPEVTLPVIPGMEGCHWPFRKSRPEHWGRVLTLLLSGEPLRAPEAVGWLIDYAGPLEGTLKTAWTLAAGGQGGPARRELDGGILEGIPTEVPGLSDTGGVFGRAARTAMVDMHPGCLWLHPSGSLGGAGPAFRGLHDLLGLQEGGNRVTVLEDHGRLRPKMETRGRGPDPRGSPKKGR